MPRQPAGSSTSVVIVDKKAGPLNLDICGFLDTAGDGSGEKNANEDFTANDIDFTFDFITSRVTVISHGLLTTNGGPIRFTTNGTLPSGLDENRDYYPIVLDNNTIRIALTVNRANDGVFVSASDSGSGIHTLHSYTRFYRQPPPGLVIRLCTMIVSLTHTNGFSEAEYANLGSSLDRGVEIRLVNDDGVICDLTDRVSIKTNGNWLRYSFNVELKSQGTGPPSNDTLVAKWSFLDSGQALRLVGDDNDRLEVILSDDLSGIISHSFYVSGVTENGI